MGGENDVRPDAETVTKSRDLRNLGGQDPGKKTRVKQGQNYTGGVGGAYVDHGALCAGVDGDPACFLPEDVRDRLIRDLQARIQDAGNRFSDAITNVRIDKLLERDQDIPLVVSMLLDVATAYCATKIIDAIKGFKAGLPPKSPIVEEFWSMGDTHTAIQTIGVEEAPKATLTDRIRGISDVAIVQSVVIATAKAKVAANSAMSKASNTPAEQKAETLNYLSRLKDLAAIGFDSLRRTLPAQANDEELVAYDESWQPGYHFTSAYIAALTEKMTSFQSSGVSKIGRSMAERVPTDENGNAIEGGPFSNEPVRRDVRVAWVHYVSGWPKTLVFQHQDGHRDLGIVRTDDPGGPDYKAQNKFGHTEKPITDEPQNGLDNTRSSKYYVDPQFWDIAIEKHRMAWGEEPPHLMVDESGWDWDPARQRAAMSQKTMKQVPKIQIGKAPTPTTVSSTHAQQSLPDDFSKQDTPGSNPFVPSGADLLNLRTP